MTVQTTTPHGLGNIAGLLFYDLKRPALIRGPAHDGLAR